MDSVGSRSSEPAAISGSAVVSGSDSANRKRCRSVSLKRNFSRNLYQLIVRQLHNDGFFSAASAVADATGVVVPRLDENADRLSKLVSWGISVEESCVSSLRNFSSTEVVERYIRASKVYMPFHISESSSVGQMAYRMSERFTSSSLGGVLRCVSFSSDGSLVACGGTNGLCAVFSLKTIEDLTALEEIRQEHQYRSLDGSSGSGCGVRNASNKITELAEARRFHEHTQSVETMRFHPSKPLLLTGGVDGTLYVRDYSQPNNRIVHKLRDSVPIRSGVFHPSGDYILYATDDTETRLLNICTGNIMTPNLTSSMRQPLAFVPSVKVGSFASPHKKGGDVGHTAALCGVDFSSDGRLFASCGMDGSVLLYDGIGGNVVASVNNAHSSVPVTSVTFSRTGNILLTAGMDSVARLWDLRRLDGAGNSFTEVMSFGEPGKCNHRSIRAAFSSNESHVLCQDTSLLAIHAYCVYTGDTSYSLTVPSHMQRGFATSPFCNAVISGGEDCRMRLWTPAWTAV
ncbi:WD domain [Trypanosoma vivax]|uniref:Cleavage stimulation factor 50 kDa subunit n=1 Tax=Trypanosoma vivax (strain Y486) TaxID=1055687 RepID=G0U4V6_TRYVY|nr:hypothetical protein TRVL_08203 [Trypanosoma vivax]KAH8611475.1 WD domain [Trypanosoma vivax]KAH8620762.1 WD domain [Trypanosoma vivax]CCC52471.1 conserved hypothetical protein [Trypanosoma vivax Y486]